MSRLDLLTAFGAAILAGVELVGQLPSSAARAEERPAPSAASKRNTDGAPIASDALPPPPTDCPPLDPTLPEVTLLGDDPPIPDLEDPSGELAPVYEHFAALDRRTAGDHLRIAVYGDSNATQDFMSGAMRRRLQAKYGDGGHGYIALARAWGWYRHMDVRHGDEGWETFNVTTHTMFDERYGHAFVAAQGSAWSRAWIATAADDAPIGKTVSRIGVSYLKGPWYGSFDALIDGKVFASVDTQAKDFAAGFVDLEVPDAPHRLEIRPTGNTRTVRIFGATFERGEPSVVVDGLGIGSMNCICMLRGDEGVHADTLRHRKYDLVIVHIGTNLFVPDKVHACMTKVIERHRAELPGVPILIMTPPDFLGFKTPPKTDGWMLGTLREMKRAARDAHAPLFDFHQAMGGEGSMARYARGGMTLPGDWVHFNAKGAAYLADRVVYALAKGYREHVTKHPRAGCPR